MNDDQLHEKYQLWWSNRTQDEYKLHETIIDYDDAFLKIWLSEKILYVGIFIPLFLKIWKNYISTCHLQNGCTVF